MRVKCFILLMFTEILQSFCDEDEHVHLRIYVPEIIKHDIHTKTVYIHVKIPTKKKKKEHGHLETYHENWNSWNAYNHGSYHQSGEKENAQKNLMNPFPPLLNNFNHQNQGQGQDPMQVHNPGQNYDPRIPFYDDYKDSGSMEEPPNPPGTQVPPKLTFETGVTGYSYPPQYETHEEVDDISPNDIQSYKQHDYNGHRQGHHVEGGHLYTDLANNFYKEKLEGSSEQRGGSSSERYSYSNNNINKNNNNNNNNNNNDYMSNLLVG